MNLQIFQQSAFVIRAAGGAVAVDFGYEVPAATVAGLAVKAALVSHNHPDHLHLPHLETLGAPVFGPMDVIGALGGPALQRTVVHPGDVFTVAGIEITAFSVDHGPNLTAPIVNLGFVFAADGRQVLFLGDMAVPSSVPPGPWDLVLVPVGGSKVFTAEAAAQFIGALGHAGPVTPIHFHGRSDRACGVRFRDQAQHLCTVRLIDVGESIEV